MVDKRKEKLIKDILKIRPAASKKREKARRETLLKSIGVKELFEEGSVEIDMKTCKGIEYQL